jgi:hypothetical protein
MPDPNNLNRYDEHSAAALIGLALMDLRQMARQVGLGHKVTIGGAEHLVFSYTELLELSLMAARGKD